MPDDVLPATTLAMTAELVGSTWTLYVVKGDLKTFVASGVPGSGIMFPTTVLERVVSGQS